MIATFDVQQVEALALMEIDGIARALVVQDAALKRAPVHMLACAPVSAGKAVLLWQGDVASTEEAMQAALSAGGSKVLDHLLLPMVHPAVVRAVAGEQQAQPSEALAVFECASLAGTLLAADAAVKCVAVHIGRLHLASGFAGKGYFTLLGTQADLEAAQDAALGAVGDRVLDVEQLPAPHDELWDKAFLRPWSLDPARHFPG